MVIPITGKDLKIIRLIYGFDTQDALAEEMQVSLATVQRYEALDDVDSKTIGIYGHQLGFDVENIVQQVASWRVNRRT